MRVLLISPVPGLDPPGGDITYTQMLVAFPPTGVHYVTYEKAMSEGTLCEHATRMSLSNAWRNRSNLFLETAWTVVRYTINRMRGRGWLFREPFRIFSVTPGEFDLIHMHVFSARFFNIDCPLIVSNAIPLRNLYLHGRGYTTKRVRFMECVETVLGKLLRINVNSYHLPKVSRVIAFTERLKKWYVTRKLVAAQHCDVVPIYLPKANEEIHFRTPRKIGFVAHDFVAKGGDVLLEAFERVRKTHPEAQLVIAGCPPQISPGEAQARNIVWYPSLPRDVLLRDFYPSLDIFAYPTFFDGMPLVILEAMSFGVAIATSDYEAMPEIVNHGVAGMISKTGSVDELTENLLRLLNPKVNREYRQAALRRFIANFSSGAVRGQLLQSYSKALENGIQGK